MVAEQIAPAMNDQLLTIPEAAARLGCSPRHVYRLIAAGRLATVDISASPLRTKRRVRRSEVDALIKQAETEQP